eukprot:14439018-Alexandrium_andersonii.AAC.1
MMGQPRALVLQGSLSYPVKHVLVRASTRDPCAAHRLRAACVACAPSGANGRQCDTAGARRSPRTP